MSRDEMEQRRLLAARVLQEGELTQTEIARRLGVSRISVTRWRRAIRDSGVESLHSRRATGRPRRLSLAQRDELAKLYYSGPRAAGLGCEQWTCRKLAAAIEARFGVRYSRDHIGRLLRRLGIDLIRQGYEEVS